MPVRAEEADDVSIHAPAWGATARRQAVVVVGVDHVSIHAPAWGATLRAGDSRFTIHVSIHAPAWGATINICQLAYIYQVSIHAPAWGATLSRFQYLMGLLLFQFTLPRGERHQITALRNPTKMFQFTLPRGERRSGSHHGPYARSFNSRSRVGSDIIQPCSTKERVFQFTLPRGERHSR